MRRATPPTSTSAPLAICPPPCNPPRRRFAIFCGGLCCPFVIALLSHQFKSGTYVYFVIFHLQRRCIGCCVALSEPGCFLPVTMYGSTQAHVLAIVVGPSPNGPHFCHTRYIRPGGVTQVDHESTKLFYSSVMQDTLPNSTDNVIASSMRWGTPPKPANNDLPSSLIRVLPTSTHIVYPIL